MLKEFGQLVDPILQPFIFPSINSWVSIWLCKGICGQKMQTSQISYELTVRLYQILLFACIYKIQSAAQLGSK